MVEGDRHIPKTMSSQHPDNVSSPPWLDTPLIEGDDEVEEVYRSWVSLGCEEAMWDAEGKDVDLNVVRKLLTTHPEYFREKIIGRDHFLTYRIPNPATEKSDKKIFFETLQSIPKQFDACEVFYGRMVNPPVFEVILPFTASVNQLIQVVNTYRKAVVQLEDIFIDYPSVRLGDIIGKIHPEKIEVIPLFEDLESMLKADAIVGRFIELTSPRYMRVFIARSDPALNNGLLAATLMAKLAIDRLLNLKHTTGIPVHTIIGVGTLPFRGGLSPTHLETFFEEYRVSTVTVQSAFRYDYPQEQVVEAIRRINKTLPIEKPSTMLESLETVVQVIEKSSKCYREFAEMAASTVARVSRLTPMRRRRKLHIGVFSYSRMLGGVELPRAIPYACSLYTLGLPPEFIGLRVLHNLTEEEFDVLQQFYRGLVDDLRRVAPLVCFDNINMLLGDESAGKPELQPLREALPLYVEDLETAQEVLNIKPGPKSPSERKYSNIINNFLIAYMEENLEEARQELLRAAKIRRCLG